MNDRAPLPAVVLLSLLALSACSDGDSPTEPGVLVTNVALPVAGAAYHGDSEHIFLGGQVAMFCGTHGTFSGSQDPPAMVGQNVVSRYTAAFTGELTLEPPLVTSTEVHPLNVQVTMAESITLRSVAGGTSTFDTELISFELQGTGAISHVLVRESDTGSSIGVTTITEVSGGRSRVETYYDVWLDISVDGGATWTRADNAVRMTLEPS